MDPVTRASLARARDAVTLALSGKETARYSLARAIRAKLFAHDPKIVAEAAFENECTAEVAKRLHREFNTSVLVPAEVLTRPLGHEAATRAMGTVPGPAGGYLVGVENLAFIDVLRARMVTRALGITTIPNLTSNIVAPRETSTATVQWQAGDGATVTASDTTLAQLSATPKTAIVITDVSEQLLRQAPAADAIFAADLAKTLAVAVDNVCINGTGGAQPLGIKNTVGVTTGQDASSASYAKVLAFVETAAAANAVLGNPGWVTNAAGAVALMQRQKFSSTFSPLWEGSPLDGSMIGFRAMSSQQLASGNLIFGSWEELVLCEWGVLELAVDTGGARFNNAQVGIRAMWMVDVMLRNPQAFVVSTNLS